jgi:hypothetical protein
MGKGRTKKKGGERFEETDSLWKTLRTAVEHYAYLSEKSANKPQGKEFVALVNSISVLMADRRNMASTISEHSEDAIRHADEIVELVRGVFYQELQKFEKIAKLSPAETKLLEQYIRASAKLSTEIKEDQLAREKAAQQLTDDELERIATMGPRTPSWKDLVQQSMRERRLRNAQAGKNQAKWALWTQLREAANGSGGGEGGGDNN